LYSEQDISDDGSQSLEEKCETLSNIPLAYQPGTQFNYSVSYDVLARVIEVISGKDFHIILKEEIFDPLEMGDTGFSVKEENVPKLMSTYGVKNFKDIMNIGPHVLSETNVNNHNPYDKGGSFQRGGTGLFSTTQDFLSFARMLLTGKSHNGETILSRNMINFMKVNRLQKSQLPLFPVDQSKIMSLTGKNEFGWGGAASTYFWVDPDEDLVGIIMTQYLGSMWPIADDMRTAVYQAID
jgi:CubicO group peptidase (beta-lactamase class C family)